MLAREAVSNEMVSCTVVHAWPDRDELCVLALSASTSINTYSIVIGALLLVVAAIEAFAIVVAALVSLLWSSLPTMSVLILVAFFRRG